MALLADGGGAGYAFDETSEYYQPGFVQGGCPVVSGGPEGESLMSALWSGGGAVRGQVEAAMKSAHPDQLVAKAKAWDSAFDEANGHANQLSGVISKLFSSWSGDDADAARKVFEGLAATLSDQLRTTGSMASSTRDMARDIKQVKDSWGHDNSTMGGIGNWVSGSDDRAAADDYQQLMRNLQTYLGRMPQQAPTQVKPGGYSTLGGNEPAPGVSGPGAAPSLGGGGGAAHLGGPSTPHIGSPHLPSSTGTHPSGTHNTGLPPAAHITDPGSGQYGGGDGATLPGAGGGAAGGWPDSGLPTIDTGSSLAGMGDGSGFGSGDGGLGGLGAGGGLGTAGGLGGGAGLGSAGAGLGAGGGSLAAGSGPGAGGIGAVAGEGAGVGGAAGRGAMMAPMGNRGNEDGDRERSTWLTEDEDVWGTTDAPPPVIGA